MSSLYKIYVSTLANKLKDNIEEKIFCQEIRQVLGEGWGQWRKYFLSYLINRQLKRDKGLIALFIDLKAAFDSVDREVLVKAMRERGVKEGLVARVEDVLRETKCRIRTGRQCGEGFWKAIEVKQRCPFSPILFNLIITNLQENMEKGKWGEVKLKERKVYTLMCIDDKAVGEGRIRDENNNKQLRTLSR